MDAKQCLRNGCSPSDRFAILLSRVFRRKTRRWGEKFFFLDCLQKEERKKKGTIIRLSTLLRLARPSVYPRYLSLQSDRAQSRTTFRATDHISTHATSQSCTNEFLSGSSDVRSFELILDDVVLHPKAALPLSPCPSFSRIFRLKLHHARTRTRVYTQLARCFEL